MPKSQFIDPNEARKPGKITFGTIPINQYQKSIAEEKKNFSNEELQRIYRDMTVIREFESLLNMVKTTGEYHGVKYKYPGPAHLSIGQEAAAVGMAYNLTVDDFILGSHRSHGEILAKGLSAIERLSDDELMKIMKEFFDGAILQVVEKNHEGDVKDLAIKFLLYGTLAEIFGRKTGINRGLGGSMHAFFTPFGIYPNNAIVGGSGDIAVGAALYKKVNQKNGIVVANIGDASMGCGPVWEGMTFASMNQFKRLWTGDYQGGMPIIFNFMNNQYGMGGQPEGETMGFEALARVGAGVNPDMMHAERIYGYNPLAVIDAFRRKKELLEEKKGPVLLDTLTYRISGHSPSDASTYRTKEEIEAWQEEDSLESFKNELLGNQVASEEELNSTQNSIIEKLKEIYNLAIDEEISPRLELDKDPNLVGKMMFSNQSIDKMEDRKPETLIPKEENPRLKQIAKRHRYGLDEKGNPHSTVKTYQLRDGIFEAILDKFYTDPTLVAYGEENRDWGGAFAVYRGLTEALPYNRLFNAPISEGAIVGTAIGYGMAGGRVIAEIMYCDFLGRAGDEVFNQLPKWQSMSGNVIKMPVVVRVSVGNKYGPQHSQDWSSLAAHIPGLKVVFPVTPYDAKGLMNAALQGTDPVIFFESQRIYGVGEWFHEKGVPEEYYEIPLGEPDIKREGKDVTILTVGTTLYTALKAADTLKEKYDVEAELIDARSLVPFNYEPVLQSIKKTGKILLSSDASSRNSFLKDMAENISEMAFDDLDGPPVVVGARNWIIPPYEQENYFLPTPEGMIDAIHEKILPLKGHQVTTNFTTNEQIRRAKGGV